MMNDNELTIIDQPLTIIDDGRIDRHPAAVYMASLAPGSHRTMRRALGVIAGILVDQDVADPLSIPWHELRFQHTAAIRAQLGSRYSYTTANKMISAMRGVLKATWRLGLMSADDYHAAVAIENIKGETVPAGRSIPQGEIVALMGTCDQTRTGIRDAAVFAVLYGCGLRRRELVSLNLTDYDQASGRLLVRGKRNKQRSVPVVGGVMRALGDWLTVRGPADGPLFVGTGNRNRNGRLTTQAIYDMLQTRAAAAGIDDLSPHDFRRTFVGDLLEAGADIVTVQKLAGHANVETTARYDRRDEKTRQRAAELLHVPYTSRVLVK